MSFLPELLNKMEKVVINNYDGYGGELGEDYLTLVELFNGEKYFAIRTENGFTAYELTSESLDRLGGAGEALASIIKDGGLLKIISEAYDLELDTRTKPDWHNVYDEIAYNAC